jgi:hypothetical protein
MVLSDYLNRYVLPRHFIRVSRFANTSIFLVVSFDLAGHVSVTLPNRHLCWTMTSGSIVSGNVLITPAKGDNFASHRDSSGSGKAVLNVCKAVSNEAPADKLIEELITLLRPGCWLYNHLPRHFVLMKLFNLVDRP